MSGTWASKAPSSRTARPSAEKVPGRPALQGPQPGMMLPARPEVGQKYRQEYKKGEAEDNGEVLATSHLVEVKVGTYEDDQHH
jgi:hypothetical protein